MIVLENEVPEKECYLVPIGDCHLGDRAFTEENERKLKGYIEWIRTTPNARCILMGDIFNVATRISKTPPFEQIEESEFEKAVKLFTPIKDKIVVAIDGNHENRLIDFANYSIMNSFCKVLDIKYGAVSAVVIFHVGIQDRREIKRGKYRQNYVVYAHHTTGGGATVGGKMNRVDKLRQLVANADVYLGGHNHMLGVIPVSTGIVDVNRHKLNYPRQVLVDCGSFLEWEGSYAEKGMMPPNKLGSPRIRLDGSKSNKDIHVSI